MTELHGLATIVNATVTLDGIEEPPTRDEFNNHSEYEAAYTAWYRRTHFWHASNVERPVWHDDANPVEIPWP